MLEIKATPLYFIQQLADFWISTSTSISKPVIRYTNMMKYPSTDLMPTGSRDTLILLQTHTPPWKLYLCWLPMEDFFEHSLDVSLYRAREYNIMAAGLEPTWVD